MKKTNNKKIFVTGISTDVGKTIVSAIVTESLQADYWKPMQSGNLNELDSSVIKLLLTNTKSIIHKEKYLLTQPLSPDAAASIDEVSIELEYLTPPKTENHLVIEGAGGLLVPFNKKNTILDLIENDYAVILVSKHYLGSINHTLLSIQALKNKGVKNIGIIFVGEKNHATEQSILNFSPFTFYLGRIPILNNLNTVSIKHQSTLIYDKLSEFINRYEL